MTPEEKARQQIDAMGVVAEMESVVRANLQRATRLRQFILQKVFTGELI